MARTKAGAHAKKKQIRRTDKETNSKEKRKRKVTGVGKTSRKKHRKKAKKRAQTKRTSVFDIS